MSPPRWRCASRATPRASTPLARAGELTGLTGVSDPYEEPVDADLVLDTQEVGAEECADRILLRLTELGYLEPLRRTPCV